MNSKRASDWIRNGACGFWTYSWPLCVNCGPFMAPDSGRSQLHHRSVPSEEPAFPTEQSVCAEAWGSYERLWRGGGGDDGRAAGSSRLWCVSQTPGQRRATGSGPGGGFLDPAIWSIHEVGKKEIAGSSRQSNWCLTRKEMHRFGRFLFSRRPSVVVFREHNNNTLIKWW